MRVLITGGSGFVGYWMGQTQPKFIDATYLNRVQYHERWQNEKWGSIVHLAPVSPIRALKHAYRYGTRVLFASSGAVYEQYTTYADNKRTWEQECTDSGADVVIARLFSFIGERLNRHSAYDLIQMAKTGIIQIRGSGNAIRSYLYGADLGRWMWKLLLDGTGIYDMGSRFPYTILEVARIVADIIPAKIEILNQPDMPNTVYMPNTVKANILGCEETMGLREAIAKVAHES
jgi:nucleoside-diphosphate-sugar epimerase